MSAFVCTARVQQDGSLELPREAQEQLGLQPGDHVQVQIERAANANKQTVGNPLYEIIGIVKEGPVDGAENHDAHLYTHRPD